MLLSHEIMNLSGTPLPLKIFSRNSSAGDEGCFYHWHEQLEIYYVLKGGVHLLCNGRERWLYAGDTALVNWCEPHKSLGFLNNTLHYIIQIDIASPLLQAVKNLSGLPAFLSQNQEVNALLDNIILEYQEKKRGYSQVVCGQLISLLGMLFRNGVGEPVGNDSTNLSIIKNILTYVHNHYDRPLSLNEVAAFAGISKPHLCRIFKKHTGVTVTQYVNSLRLNLAVTLIKEGLSITEASAVVGFCDYNYFSRCFKKEKGYSPSQIRKCK